MKSQLFFFFLMMITASADAQNIWSLNGGFSSTGTTDLTLQTNGTTRLTIFNSNGYVGIGTTPTEFIDVNGTARLRSIPLNNALTRILVSDVNGKVFWRDVSSIVGGTPSGLPYALANGTTVGVGPYALTSITTGSYNSAFGSNSLNANTTGGYNSAFGANSLGINTTGNMNTALGMECLYFNTTGNYNSAFGMGALKSNTEGTSNTAGGLYAMLSNTAGSSNTAYGAGALSYNTIGNGNTALGNNSLSYSTTGSNNTAIGNNSGPTLNNCSNTTSIGAGALVTGSNQIRIGNSSVISIGGQVSWTTFSDGRFKTDIKEDVAGLDFISRLRPVSYSMDQDKIDSFMGIAKQDGAQNPRRTTRQTGFIAQEVDALINESGYAFHGVEVPQNDRDPYAIRYAEFVVPLVKAVQELNAKLIEQQKTIDALTGGMAVKGFVIESDSEKSELFQNNPNPASMDTEIRMTIPGKVNNATLYIYDINGNQIQTRIITGRGNVVTKVDGDSLGAGIYLYALATDNHVTEAKRMILTK
jgi:trimeric autotransporter adhesin